MGILRPSIHLQGSLQSMFSATYLILHETRLLYRIGILRQEEYPGTCPYCSTNGCCMRKSYRDFEFLVVGVMCIFDATATVSRSNLIWRTGTSSWCHRSRYVESSVRSLSFQGPGGLRHVFNIMVQVYDAYGGGTRSKLTPPGLIDCLPGPQHV